MLVAAAYHIHRVVLRAAEQTTAYQAGRLVALETAANQWQISEVDAAADDGVPVNESAP
jgi:CO/xanthine dehydrogenase Mo-binding subunit